MFAEQLKERFGDAIVASETTHGMESIVLDRERAVEIFKVLREDPAFAFNFLMDLTAVDWPERVPRFDVVYHLFSLGSKHRLRLKVWASSEEPWVFSVVPIWKSADWLERECYDMFGIEFRGHPDLRRILMFDSFVGHPLRRDYPYNYRQPIVEEVDPIVTPRPPSR